MKNFTVTIGGETRTIPGPDNATQEQAQAEAERQMQGQQSADLQKDLTGPGHLVANVAQGAAELAGGPAQLLGTKPGPLYQQAENAKTTTGDKIARAAGASAPLGPLGAGKLVVPAVGAVEGASAPASSGTQRMVNTGLGALSAQIPGISPGAAAHLDHLIGTGFGALLGHGGGGPLGGLATMWGARLGNQLSAHAPIATYARQLLTRFPPSVVARMLADAGYPVSKILGSEYDYMTRDRDNQ